MEGSSELVGSCAGPVVFVAEPEYALAALEQGVDSTFVGGTGLDN